LIREIYVGNTIADVTEREVFPKCVSITNFDFGKNRSDLILIRIKTYDLKLRVFLKAKVLKIAAMCQTVQHVFGLIAASSRALMLMMGMVVESQQDT